MTRARRTWLIAFGMGIVLVSGVLWALATDSGTRWLLGRASGFLPEQLVLGETRGSLLGGVRFQSIEWHSEAVQVVARNLYINIEVLPLISRRIGINDLDVEQVDIAAYDGEGEAEASTLPSIALPFDVSILASSIRNVSLNKGPVVRTADDISLTGGLRGSNLDIEKLVFRSAWLNFELDANTTLADLYPGRAHIDWQWVDSKTMQFAGELQIEGDLQLYDVQHKLNAPLTVSTSGKISYLSGTLFANLINDWESFDWELGDRILRSSGGSLHLKGNTTGFAVTLDANAQLDDLPETKIELGGDADLENIQISHLHAANGLGRLVSSGNVRWLPQLQFELTYALSELDPSIAFDTIAGDLAVEGRVAGRFSEHAPVIDLRIARLDGNVNGHPIQGNADIAYADDTLSVADGLIQLGSNRVLANGSMGETIALNADFDIAAVGEFVPDASGAIRGGVALSGSRARPDIRVDITGTSLEWMTYSVESLSVSADVSATDSGFAEISIGEFTIDQTTLDSIHVSSIGRIGEHTIRTTLRSDKGDLLLEAAGGYSQGRWIGLVDSLELHNEAVGRWSSDQPSELVASLEQFALSSTCLMGPSGSGSACIGGNFDDDGSASFELSVAEVPLSVIPTALPETVNVSGFINANAQGKIDDQRLTGELGISLRDAMVDTSLDDETVSIAFTNAVGQASISDNRVESEFRMEMADGAGTGGVQLSIQDFVDTRSAIVGRGDLTINDTSLFAVLIPGVTNPRGKIEGAATISGSLGEPVFLGEIVLTDGAFGVRQAGIEISDLVARLTQQEAGQLRLEGSARSGEGQISIQGRTRVSADSGVRTELILSGENFELVRLPDWQVAASPAVTIVFDEQSTLINGELGIPIANVTIKEIPETAESPSRDTIVHRAEGSEAVLGRRVEVDVKTTLGEDVQFSGFGLKTGLEGTLRLQGGTHAPYVSTGKLALLSGRYKAYGQELEIERGELIFNGSLDNPRLDVRAVRRLTDVVAGIRLTGTPAQLRSEVFSEPALSDAETLSYLLTGRPLATAANAGEGETLNNAAFALGLSGAGPITSQIRAGLGLETLTVEGGADDGRIIAGKRFGDRLLVEYGYGLIDKLGTLLLRYQLNDRLVLESRTGTVSNLDVVYSVKKR